MEKRKPTYSSAVRMAQLVAMLSESWRPLPVHVIAERLGISLRTLFRYRKALNEQLSGENGSPFLKVVKEGGRESWYLTDQEEVVNANSLRIVSVFVAKALLKSLKGTVIEETIGHIWNAATGPLPPSRKKQLELFDKKVRYTGFARKSYEEKDLVLAAILRGLVHQKKLSLLHYSHKRSGKRRHIVHPYTSLLHRDALYLIAYAETYGQIRTFAVDRIEEATATQDEFRYPQHYDPSRMIEGSFGILDNPDAKPFTITLWLDKNLWEYVTTRNWHPTQKFTPNQDGSFTMQLALTNVEEFVPWVLQFGGDAKVLSPASLKKRLQQELVSALKNY